MIPVTILFPPAIGETGEEWFERQPEGKQRALLGRDYYEAYKGGAYKFGELSDTHTDSVYGDMRTRAPLWKLLGAEAPLRK